MCVQLDLLADYNVICSLQFVFNGYLKVMMLTAHRVAATWDQYAQDLAVAAGFHYQVSVTVELPPL